MELHRYDIIELAWIWNTADMLCRIIITYSALNSQVISSISAK